jgi:rubrerythrin
MSEISSRIDAIELINSDRQTPDDEDVRFELRCAACGYGAVVRIPPEACPVCRGTLWEHVPSHRTDEVFAA